jgi:tyrosyl-tRNA synthetase
LNKNIEDFLRKKGVNTFDNDNEIMYINNYEFYREMGTLEFLRDVGKNFRINTMLSRDSVKSRMERGKVDRELKNDEGLSYTEFSY